MFAQDQIVLGTVISPSGTVLIIDAGLLGMWSHDLPPWLPDGIVPDAVTARANTALDLEIIGADAAVLGRALDRQWHPQFLYDIPSEHVAELCRRGAELAKAQRLDARMVVCDARVPHRRRAEHALEAGRGAGEVQFHGVGAGVIRGLPAGEPLSVVGAPMPPDDPNSDCLRSVWLEVSNHPIVHSERFAHVGVDWARLLFVDLDAVAGWEHERPIDGQADFAFWGRDAALAATRTEAGKLEAGVWGWRDLPASTAAERGVAVEELRAREGLKFATDFRPHSHHYQLMEQVRASPNGAGTVGLGDARACGFMTTWGDGVFALYRDLDQAGRLVRVRIELAGDALAGPAED